MSATDQIRAMLDGLMGTQRAEESHDESHSLSFDNYRVCKCFLLGCCPNAILSGTRVGIGDCASIHNLALKADYEKAAQTKSYYFEYEALDHLEHFMQERDKRTEAAKRKLKDSEDEMTAEAAEKLAVLNKVSINIGTTLAKAEQLGAAGEVEQSLKLMSEVDALNKEKANLELEFRMAQPNSTYQQQKLQVCEVCSSYLGLNDNDRRLADHFGGKLHLSFMEIREHMEALRIKVAEFRAAEQKLREESQHTSSSSHHREHSRHTSHHRESNHNHVATSDSRSSRKSHDDGDEKHKRESSRKSHDNDDRSHKRERSSHGNDHRDKQHKSTSHRHHTSSRDHHHTGDKTAIESDRRRDEKHRHEKRSNDANGRTLSRDL